MDPIIGGALITGGAGLLGHALGQNRWSGADQSAHDLAMQKEFAQMGLQWKVADAKAAGLHPMAAIGAPGINYQPSMAGGDSGSDLGDVVSNMGQDIGRAVMQTQSEPQKRLADLQLQSMQMDVEGKALDNQVRMEKLRELRTGLTATGSMPSPMDGTPVPGVKLKPAEVTASRSGVPAQQAGAINDYGLTRTNTGLTIVPSVDVKERIEDQMIPELMWSVRNYGGANFGKIPPPSKKEFPLPPGYDQWKWNHLGQEFQPYNSKRGYFAP